MNNPPIGQIDRNYINSIISNQVRESRTLDYKDKLPGNTRDEKKEFLADVTAFANAAGGDMVFGIQERRENGKPSGVPESVSGFGNVNRDDILLRLESIIRDGVEPRISGIRMQWVEMDNGGLGLVLVLRIPKSWLSPHMVKTGDSRFYSRNSVGKYPLDVSEIRSAFSLSESLPEKVRRFRDERIARIVAEETPVPLRPLPKTVLHLLPVGSLDPTTRIDTAPLQDQVNELSPMNAMGGWRNRHNLEGFMTYSQVDNSAYPSTYLQIFRNGAIEAVESVMIQDKHRLQVGSPPVISTTAFEYEVIKSLTKFVKLEDRLGMEPPIFIILSLIGVKGFGIFPPRNWFSEPSNYVIDRDMLLLPESILQGFGEQSDKLLQPAFDALWQCAGYKRDIHYQDSGEGRWSINP